VGYVKVTEDNAVKLAARTFIMLVKAGVANELEERRQARLRDPEYIAQRDRSLAEFEKTSQLLSRACGYGEPLTADEEAWLVEGARRRDEEEIEEKERYLKEQERAGSNDE
jgi:hypothetical protein